ncbi:HD domain-containing protein [Candidatus Gottesmanbacteria bacterium]|nr:HD domain-containing protein [Candidatus Gottesmanbacteria bacterium]
MLQIETRQMSQRAVDFIVRQDQKKFLREPQLKNELRRKLAEWFISRHGTAAALLLTLTLDAYPDDLSRLGLTLKDVQFGALLHDIGKLLVPEPLVWYKPRTELTSVDWIEMDRHTVPYGAYALRLVEQQVGPLPEAAYKMVVGHHEKRDGTGKPYGLVGDQIALSAQFLTVADQVLGRCEARAYRDDHFTLADAVADVEKGRATKYEPLFFDHLASVLQGNLHMQVHELEGLGPYEGT